MTRIVHKLADGLVQALVPSTTARAECTYEEDFCYCNASNTRSYWRACYCGWGCGDFDIYSCICGASCSVVYSGCFS